MASWETKRKTRARRERLPITRGRTRGIRKFRNAMNRGLRVAATLNIRSVVRNNLRPTE
jgi:hypothetical protein